MKIKVKLLHETRTIEHVERVEVLPDEVRLMPDNDLDSINIHIERAEDGGLVLVITEEEA